MKTHLAIGKIGERIAQSFLKKKNYKIQAVNWRFKRAEIDIIAKKDNIIIFIEVKTRSSSYYGVPEIFVDIKKKRLISDAASEYMFANNYNGEFRFDIIGIILKTEQEFSINHSEDAFFPGLSGFE